MPWNIMLVTHSKCGSGFFSTPRMLFCSVSSSSASFTYFLRTCSMAQWLMRCASPSTPASLRMMSWMVLIVVPMAMGAYCLVRMR